MPQWITEGLELNGAHQLLVYADDVNVLRGNVHNIKENTEALIFGSNYIGQTASVV